MAFHKQKQTHQKKETQIPFRNVPIDRKSNPTKTYYAMIETEGSDKLYLYEGKFRSEAKAYFLDEARTDRGVFKSMGVL